MYCSYRVIFDALEREAIGGGLGPSNAQGVLDHGPQVFSCSILPPTFEVTGASGALGVSTLNYVISERMR
jgi:hypothetical protein